MQFLSAFVVLVFAVGVYSNCGCLKCNKQLNVYAPRGSGLKIIYKNSPCSCLTGIPYSLQVPVQKPSSSGAGRSYGYQIQEGNVEEIAPCQIPQEYNVQLQVPQQSKPPSYLLGLVAKTDRVLISGPPEPLPAPGCPRAIIEPVQVAQGSDGDSLADFFYYGNRGRPGCGCLRYDRKIRFPKVQPIKSPQIMPNTPLLNLQFLQRHFYTPPKSNRKIYLDCDANYKTSKPKYLNSQAENFHRISIFELLNKENCERVATPESAENVLVNSVKDSKRRQQTNFNSEENPKNSASKCRKNFQVFRIDPGMIRIYRQVFRQPSQKNSALLKNDARNRNSALNNPDVNSYFPNTYQQVFIKSRPKMFRVNFNSDMQDRNKMQNSDTQQKIIISNSAQEPLYYSANSNRQLPNSKFPKFNNDFRKIVQNSDKNLEQNLPKNVQPRIIQLRNNFLENYGVRNSEPRRQNSDNLILQSAETGSFNTNTESQNIQDNITKIKQNRPNSDLHLQNSERTLQNELLKPLLIFSKNGEDNENLQNPKERLEANFPCDRKITENSDNQRKPTNNNTQADQETTDNYNKKIFNRGSNQNSAENWSENTSKHVQVVPNLSNSSMGSELNFQNFLKNLHNSSSTQNLPKNYHVIKSQQLLLTEGNSGSKIFRSKTHQFSVFSDSLLPETFDSILSKNANRPKRSINWKMLALKPENPPKYLRAQNSAPAYFPNYKNENEASKSIPRIPIREKLKGLHVHESNHGRKVFVHSGQPSIYGVKPSAYGVRSPAYGGRHSVHGGRHSVYGKKPPVHGGKHSVLGKKPLVNNKNVPRLPRENNQKKVELKKKKNNVMLKSTLKKANKIIKDWFSKGSSLSPPEIQLPSHIPESVKKSWFVEENQNQEPAKEKRSKLKHLSRHKRAIRSKDEDILPFFSIFDDIEETNRKTIKGQKHAQKLHNAKPSEAFLEPFNFEHILHPTPLVHLLNTPVRLLNNFHKLKSHVNPVVGTIPKVIQVSRRYVIGLLRNLGKNAIHLGTNFIKGFTKLKKSKILHKIRHRRSLDSGKYTEDSYSGPYEDDYSSNEHLREKEHYESARNIWEGEEEELENKRDGDEEIINTPYHYPYQETERKGWGVEETDGGEIEAKDEDEGAEYNEQELVDQFLGKFIDQRELQDMFAKFGNQKFSNLPNDEPLADDTYTDTESSFNGRRRKRDIDETNGERSMNKRENPGTTGNIFMELLQFLMSLGTKPKTIENHNDELENPNHQQEKHYLYDSSYKEDLVESNNLYKKMKGDIGEDYAKVSDKVQNRDDAVLQPKEETNIRLGFSTKERKKREISESDIEVVTGKIRNSGNEPRGFINLWKKVVDFSGDKMLFPDITDEAEDSNLNNDKAMESSRRKREAINGPILISSELSNVNKPIEEMKQNGEKPETSKYGTFEEIPEIKQSSEKEKPLTDIKNKILKVIEETNESLSQPRSKPSYPSDLDVQVQTIKDEIAQILTTIQTLINYDFSKDLKVYQNLLKLQNIKSKIVQIWKALTIENKPEIVFPKKNQLLTKLEEAQELKEFIFQELAQRINNQESLFRGNWIKTLVGLQKLHCIVKNINQKLSLDDDDFNIDLLESLDIVDSKNQEEILISLKQDQEDKLDAQIELVENLKIILDKKDGKKIKQEAKIIWEINNVEKLQNESIFELNQKMSQGLKIRKELKILFDLQTQLEKCERKQQILMENLRKDSVLTENDKPRI